MKRFLLPFLFILSAGFTARAQIVNDFKPAGDSLRALMKERTTVDTPLGIERIMKRGNTLDFYFNPCLADYPWRAEDVSWFLQRLRDLFPPAYGGYAIGQVFAKRLALEDLVMPALTYRGEPVAADAFRVADPRGREAPIVHCPAAMQFPKGLTGRNIALWQSHGRYYEESTDRWEWQRGAILRTVEDLYTQSYVLPFLIPMLENAGAYVMTPRERDTQRYEVICDNDDAFKGRREGLLRREGRYEESGRWKDAGEGFADAKATYLYGENPFRMGTARQTEVEDGRKAVRAQWTPSIPERGMYSVYVSYKSLPNSTESAHYTVYHLGGRTEFIVNQKIGGGTWIYLGTFEFAEGEAGSVTLDNSTPEGRSFRSGTVVTADAVKFGGGMGKVARGLPGFETASGMPAYTEGAMYWMQWAGIDTSIYKEDWKNDYTKDYAGRGAWVTHMAGGSRSVPAAEGRGVPFDLSLAFHSDAGVHQQDSTVGTLSIYTLQCDGSLSLPDGTSRYVCRELADYVQTQIVRDIRRDFEPLWNRRQLWDRSYSESRTTSVPAMLLELLSHQNFADMKYGLDPSFRFTVSRAVYKGMLKFLSNRYGCSYAVQPLPVHSFAVCFADDRLGTADLSWLPARDAAEPTARPQGYILRTRIDDGAFDEGFPVSFTEKGGRCTAKVHLNPGHLYSFQIIAYNEGGKSFPSETLSIGVPEKTDPSRKVLVINNFTRVAAPAWFDTPQYAGFDDALDSGMPYLYEINYIGSQYEFRRDLPWMDDDCPGFGASWVNEAGKLVPGNTFDFPAIHGKALLKAGCPFCSVSAEAFADEARFRSGYLAADLICGKQVTTPRGRGAVPDRYQVFPKGMQTALAEFTSGGGNVLVSGSHIGTDVWDKIYPAVQDSLYAVQGREFVQKVLGFKWITNHATSGEHVSVYRNGSLSLKGGLGFHRLRNDAVYAAESPDGLAPVKGAESFLRYDDTQISAGVCYNGRGYRTVCLGFPVETIASEEEIDRLITAVMKYFSRK